MPRVGPKSRGFKSSSRSRVASRRKRARSSAVTKARAKTITRIAKRAVTSITETKYTQFHQLSTTAWSIQRGDQFNVIRLTNAASIFPAQGDNVHQRDGLKYRILGFNVFFGALCERMNINSPLEVRVLRIHPRQNVRDGADNDGIVYVKHYYPQSESSDIVTFANGVPVVVGKFDPNIGRVVKSYKLKPDTKVIPGNNLYHMATPSDINVAHEMKYHKVFIPYNHVIHAASGSAEIPTQMPKFCLAFRCAQQNTTAWDVQYVYTQCVFKDM